MQTNKTIAVNSELHRKGRDLLRAAYEYWRVYQKELGGSAVVWLEDDNGHFVLFTRSEYREEIMRVVPLVVSKEPLVYLFEKET
jgi:hypothetical protein